MAQIAVIKEGKVTNVVVADAIEVAQLFFEDELVEVTEETGSPSIGFAFDAEAGRFVPACYYSGWTFDRESWSWKSPIPYPEDATNGIFYEWDNETETWARFDVNSLPVVQLESVDPSPEEVTATETVADQE